jgi:hypothetical protein
MRKIGQFLSPSFLPRSNGHLLWCLAEAIPMKKRSLLFGSILALATIAGGVMIAQAPPAENVGRRHPNLEAAQRLVGQAYDHIVAAQQANEWDMDGHAQRAKDLLDQANREIKAAAEAANHNHR